MVVSCENVLVVRSSETGDAQGPFDASQVVAGRHICAGDSFALAAAKSHFLADSCGEGCTLLTTDAAELADKWPKGGGGNIKDKPDIDPSGDKWPGGKKRST
jgi:hypothetical protein